MLFMKSCPIILIGSSSSGTTLISRLLLSAGVVMGRLLDVNAESLFFQGLNRSMIQQFNGSWYSIQFYPRFLLHLACSDQLSRQTRNRLNLRFLHTHFGHPKAFLLLFKRNKKRVCWGWKDPRNTLTLPVWLSVFPRAKVLHVIRHGLDVAISLREREEKRRNHAKAVVTIPSTDPPIMEDTSLEACFRLWEKYVNIGRSYKWVLDDRYLELHFEDLLDNPKEHFKRIMHFGGYSDRDIVPILENCMPLVDSGRTKRFKNPKYSEFYDMFCNHQLLQELGYSLERESS